MQEKFQTLKEENEAQVAEKKKVEEQLRELKEENTTMQNKSTENSTNTMSPEQYLEVLGEEKDLPQMLHYCQLVNAKYMQMLS